MRKTGVRELKNNLSYYLREVKHGKKILVAEREKIIATIVPIERADEDSNLLSLVKEGFATWKGGKPVGSRHPAIIKGKTIAEIVLEDRR